MNEKIKKQIVELCESLRPYEKLEICADKEGKPFKYFYKRWDTGIIDEKGLRKIK